MELAQHVGRSQSFVSKLLSPFEKFPEDLRAKIGKGDGKIPITGAAAIAPSGFVGSHPRDGGRRAVPGPKRDAIIALVNHAQQEAERPEAAEAKVRRRDGHGNGQHRRIAEGVHRQGRRSPEEARKRQFVLRSSSAFSCSDESWRERKPAKARRPYQQGTSDAAQQPTASLVCLSPA